LALSDSIPNKHISILHRGQRSSGSMGAFESVSLVAIGRMLAMVCAPFLVCCFALFGTFGHADIRFCFSRRQ